ncbi:MAG: sulfite oxidase [Pedosphaera sp.]|nr:sulfite oxidase [Pedosphaera sp.]
MVARKYIPKSIQNCHFTGMHFNFDVPTGTSGTAVSRRSLLRGSVAMAAYTLAARPLSAFGLEPTLGDVSMPFLDIQPVGKMLYWQKLNQWITANEDLYEVSHYGRPKVDLGSWKLDFSGYLKKPRSFTLAELQARRHKTVTATLECGGNGSSLGFCGAIGNMRWTGTPLGPLLRDLGLSNRSQEFVFYGADEKIEKIRDKEYLQHFARSLPKEHALQDEILLAWAINGKPLDETHGAPLRLVVPGWFGISWVKWLTRIEVLDRRFMGKWMAREYVTIRGEDRDDGTTNWRETSVCNMNVKSVAARCVRRADGSLRITGAAWSDGTPIQRVEVRIDDGPWQPALIERKPESARFTWSFWRYDWKNPPAGEHTFVSRAIDADGRVQPGPDDPAIKNKRTFWDANQQWVRRVRVGTV